MHLKIYDGKGGEGDFRSMTLDEVKALSMFVGSRVYVLSIQEMLERSK